MIVFEFEFESDEKLNQFIIVSAVYMKFKR